MPVFYCSGEGCERMISVSAIPGGNPVAKADPEGFATEYQRCGGCKKFFCDRCASAGAACPGCGGALGKPTDEALAEAKGAFGDKEKPAAAWSGGGDGGGGKKAWGGGDGGDAPAEKSDAKGWGKKEEAKPAAPPAEKKKAGWGEEKKAGWGGGEPDAPDEPAASPDEPAAAPDPAPTGEQNPKKGWGDDGGGKQGW